MGHNNKLFRNYINYLYNGIDVRGPGEFSVGSSSIPHRIYHKLIVRKLLEEKTDDRFVTLDVEHTFIDGWRCDILLVQKHHARIIEIQNPNGYVINVHFDTIEEGYGLVRELKKRKIISKSRYRNLVQMLEAKTHRREESGRIHIVRAEGVDVERVSDFIARANDPPELKRKCGAWDDRSTDLVFAISANGFEEYIEDIWNHRLPVAELYVVEPEMVRNIRRKLAEIDNIYAMNDPRVYEPEWEQVLRFRVDLEGKCLHSIGNGDKSHEHIEEALEKTSVRLCQ